MEDSTESWTGRGTPPVLNDSAQLWYHWYTKSGETATYTYGHTLRLVGGSANTTYHITTDFTTKSAYDLVLGGLIVEAGQGGFEFGTTTPCTETILLQAATNCNFEALILSNFAFTDYSDENKRAKIESNANFRVGAGITMNFGRVVNLAADKNLSFTRAVAADESSGENATIKSHGLQFSGGTSTLTLGDHVELRGDSVSGTVSNVSLLGGAKWVIGGGTLGITGQLSLAAGSALNLTGVTLNLTGTTALTAPLGGSEGGFALNVSGENVLSLSDTSLWSGNGNLLTLSDLTGDGTLTIELNVGLLTNKEATGSMSLIGGWQSGWGNLLNVRLTGENAGNYAVSINESGQLTWVKGDSLTWTGGVDDTTLTLGTGTRAGDTKWNEQDHTFVASDALTLTAAASTTVQLGDESTLSIRSLTLSAGAEAENASFAFSAGESPSAEKVLAVAEDVNVNTDTTLGEKFVLQVGSLSSIKLAEGKSLSGEGTVRVQLAGDETRSGTSYTANTNLEISGKHTLTLGPNGAITMGASETLTIDEGTTVRVNVARGITLGAGAEIVLERGAVLRADVLANLKVSEQWLTISGEGEVLQGNAGAISAAGIQFDANYHIQGASGGASFNGKVGTVNVRDLIIDGNFTASDTVTINITGLVGANSGDHITTNQTWNIDVASGATKEWKGGIWGVNSGGGISLTKQGGGTQKIRNMGNVNSLDVQEGTLEFTSFGTGTGTEHESTVTGTVKVGGASGKSATLKANTMYLVGGSLQLEAQGTVTVTGSMGLNGTSMTMAEGAQLTVSSGLTLQGESLSVGLTSATISGAVNVMSGAATLDVQGLLDLSGATSLAINGTGLKLDIGTATAADGTSLLADAPVGQLRLNDNLVATMTSLGRQGKLTLTLADLTADTATEQSQYTYSLFDLNGGTLSEDQRNSYKSMLAAVLRSSAADESGKRAVVTVDANGRISVALVNVEDLTWDTSGSGSTWSDGGSGWTGGKLFVPGDSVTFTDTGSPATLHEITISGSVAPQNMTVDSGTWKFSAAAGSGLVVAGNFTVGSESASEGTTSVELAGAGTYTFSQGVNVKEGATLVFSSTATTGHSLGTVSVASGATVVIVGNDTYKNYGWGSLQGEGFTLVLRNIGGNNNTLSGGSSTLGAGNDSDNPRGLYGLLGGADSTVKITSLVVEVDGDNASVLGQYNASDGTRVFDHITDSIEIRSGASFWVGTYGGDMNLLGDRNPSGSGKKRIIYIDGAGYSTDGWALRIHGSSQVRWDISLEKATTGGATLQACANAQGAVGVGLIAGDVYLCGKKLTITRFNKETASLNFCGTIFATGDGNVIDNTATITLSTFEGITSTPTLSIADSASLEVKGEKTFTVGNSGTITMGSNGSKLLVSGGELAVAGNLIVGAAGGAEASTTTTSVIELSDGTLNITGGSLTLNSDLILKTTAEKTLSGGTVNLGGRTLTKEGSASLTLQNLTVDEDDEGGLFVVKENEVHIYDHSAALSKWGFAVARGGKIYFGSTATGSVQIAYLKDMEGDTGAEASAPILENPSATYHANLKVGAGDDQVYMSSARFIGNGETAANSMNLEKNGSSTQRFTATDFGDLYNVTVSGGTLEFSGSGNIHNVIKLTNGGVMNVDGKLTASGSGQMIKLDTRTGSSGGGTLTLSGGLQAPSVLLYGDANNEYKLVVEGTQENTLSGTLFVAEHSTVELKENTVLTVQVLQDYASTGGHGGAITGGGKLVVKGLSTAGVYAFNGTVSANMEYCNTTNSGTVFSVATFTGENLTVSAGTMAVTGVLGGTDEDSQATTGVTLTGDGKLKVSTTGTAEVASLTAGVSGEDGVWTKGGKLEVDAGKTLTVGTVSGVLKELTLNGGLTLGGGTEEVDELTVADGMTLATNGTLTLNGATMKLGKRAVVETVSDTFLFAGGVTLSGGGTLGLANGANFLNAVTVGADGGVIDFGKVSSESTSLAVTALSGSGTLELKGTISDDAAGGVGEVVTATLSGTNTSNVVVKLTGEQMDLVAGDSGLTLKGVTGNGGITGGTLKIKGGDMESTADGDVWSGLLGDGATVELESGNWSVGHGANISGSLTVKGTLNLVDDDGAGVELRKTLVIGADGKLAGSGTLEIEVEDPGSNGAITLSGYGNTLTGLLGNDVKLVLGSGATDYQWTYQLFSNLGGFTDFSSFKTLVEGKLNVEEGHVADHSNYKYVLNQDGRLSIALLGENRTWMPDASGDDKWVQASSDSESDADWGNNPFLEGDTAIFSSTTGDTVTLSGTIVANAVKVGEENQTGAAWTWTMENTNARLHVLGAVSVNGTGTSLTLNVTGDYTFDGGITVGEGATVVVLADGTLSWKGKGISGGGTVELKLAHSTNTTYSLGTNLPKLVTGSLGALKLSAQESAANGVQVDLTSGVKNTLDGVTNLYVGSGVSLGIVSGATDVLAGGTSNKSLHLEGAGVGTDRRGALHFGGTATVGRSVVLEGEGATTITVASGVTGTLAGLSGGGKDLNVNLAAGGEGTANVNGTLVVQSITGELGVVSVAAGTLKLDFAGSSSVAKSVKLATGTTLDLSGAAEGDARTYTIGTLTGAGDVASSNVDTGVNLALGGADAASNFGESADFAGAISGVAEVQVSGGYWWWSNTGTNGVSVKVGGGANVKLGGTDTGTMTFSGKSITNTGNLTLNNVKLGQGVDLTSGTTGDAVGAEATTPGLSIAGAVSSQGKMTVSGGTVTLGAGGSWTLGAVTLGGDGKQVTQQSYLDLSGATLNTSGLTDGKSFTLTIDVTGRNVDHGINDVGNAWALKLTKDQITSLTTLMTAGEGQEAKLTIKLTNWSNVNNGMHISFLDTNVDSLGTTQQAFEGTDGAGGWKETVEAFLKLVQVYDSSNRLQEGMELTIDQWGHLDIQRARAFDLTWNGAEQTTMDWKEKDGEVWDDGGQKKAFWNNDNVTFKSNLEGVTVTVEDGISAGKVTVEAKSGGTTNWTFGLKGALEVDGTWTLQSGANVAVQKTTGSSDNTKLTLAGLTLAEGSRFGVDYTADYGAIKELSFTKDATISLAKGDGAAQPAKRGTVSLDASTIGWENLTLSGAVDVTITTRSSSNIAGKGLTLTGGASLTIAPDAGNDSKTTSQSLGAVSLGEGSTLTVRDRANWTMDSSPVTGAGTLVLENTGSTKWSLGTQTGLPGTNMIRALLANVTEDSSKESSLAKLELKGDILLRAVYGEYKNEKGETTSAGNVSYLKSVKDLVMGTDTQLELYYNLTTGTGKTHSITIGSADVTDPTEATIIWGREVGTASTGSGAGESGVGVTTNVDLDWDIALAGNAKVASRGNGVFTYNGTLNAGGHTLTVSKQTDTTEGKNAGELTLGESFKTEADSTGTIAVDKGAQLTLNLGTENTGALAGYAIELTSGEGDGKGGALVVGADATIGTLNGGANTAISGGHTLTVAGIGGKTSSFSGALGTATEDLSGLTLQSAFTYGGTGYVGTLTLASGDDVTGKDLTLTGNLTVESLAGKAGIVKGTGEEPTEGSLTLKDSSGGNFDGAIGVTFTYEGDSSKTYTLGGSFTGSSLTVKSGNLTVGTVLTNATALTLENGKLTLTGGTAKSLTVTTGTPPTSTTLALAADTTLTTTTGTLSSLDLGTHTLTVNGGNLAASALSFNGGGGLKLGITKAGDNLTGATLTLKSALSSGTKLKLTLVGEGGTKLEVDDFKTGKGYTLFTEKDWQDTDLTSLLDFSVDGIALGSYDSWHIDNTGKLTLTQLEGDLVWAGKEGSNTWSLDQNNKNWNLDATEPGSDRTGVEFASGHTTIFDSSQAEVSSTVNISASGGTLKAEAMQVKSGAFTFTGGALNASTLSVGDNATATFRNTATFSGALSGQGTLELGEEEDAHGSVTLNGATGNKIGALKMASGTTLNLGGASGALEVASLSGAGGTISGGTLTLKTTSGLSTASAGNTFSGDITGSFTYDVTGGSTGSSTTDEFTLSGAFSGTSLTVTNGTLKITGATDSVAKTQSFTGSVSVSSGATLVLGDGDITKVSIDTKGLTLTGTLEFDSKAEINGDITLENAKTLSFKASGAANAINGALTYNGGTLSWEGTLSVQSLSGSAALTNSSNGGLTLTGTGTNYGETLTLNLGTGVLATEKAADDDSEPHTHTFSGNVTVGGVNVGTGTTLTLSGSNNSLGSSVDVVEGTLKLANGTLTNLSGSGIVEATGAITVGTATDGFGGTLNTGSSGSITVTASGDLSVGALAGSGKLQLATNTLKLKDRTSNFAGTLSGGEEPAATEASVEIAGTGIHTFTAKQELNGVTFSAGGTLSLGAGSTVTTLTVSAAGTLKVESEGLTVDNWAGSSALSKLTLEGNLTVQGGSINASAVDGTGKLVLWLADGSESTVTGPTLAASMATLLAADATGLNIELDSARLGNLLTSGEGDIKEYQLFGETYSGGNVQKDKLHLTLTGTDAGDWTLSFDAENGKLLFVKNDAELVWGEESSDSSVTWNSSGTGKDTGWKQGEEDRKFEDAKGVTFLGTTTGELTVNVNGAITVKKLTIGASGSGPSKYTFSAAVGVEQHKITVNGGLVLNDATALNVETTVNGAVSGTGALEVGATVTLGANALSGYNQAVTLNANGELVLTGDNTLSGGLVANGGALSGNLTSTVLSGSGNLTLKSGKQTLTSTDYHGVVTLEDSDTLTGGETGLTVGGLVAGDSANATVGGSITINDTGSSDHSFGGKIAGGFTLTMTAGNQAFTQNLNFGTLNINGGKLTLADGSTITTLSSENSNGELASTGALTVGSSGTTTYGGKLSVAGLTLGEDMEYTYTTDTSASAGVLKLDGHTLTLSGTLAATDLQGASGAVVGTVGGNGTLKLSPSAAGNFGGTISSNLTFNGGENGFIVATFSGGTLAVEAGSLEVGTLSNNSTAVTFGESTEGGTLTLKEGGMVGSLKGGTSGDKGTLVAGGTLTLGSSASTLGTLEIYDTDSGTPTAARSR